MMRIVAVAFALVGAVAPAHADPAATKYWFGTFNRTGSVEKRGGVVELSTFDPAGALALTDSIRSGDLTDGVNVAVINPLLGQPARGKVRLVRSAGGSEAREAYYEVAVETSTYGSPLDAADGSPLNAMVVVVPATANVKTVKLSSKAASAIGAAVASTITRDLEVGAIDLDGDGIADLAIAYGCIYFVGGGCVSTVDIALVRDGAKWTMRRDVPHVVSYK